MSDGYLLGLDFGGGGGRCLLIELGSRRILTASRAWSGRAVPGSGGLGHELDLDLLFRRLGEASREVLARADVRPERVLGIAASAMRFGLVVLDEHRVPLIAVPNRDGRAVGPALEIAEKHGEEILQQTGHWPMPIFAGLRLGWLRSQPELWERARHALAINDWVTYRLCGELASEPSQGSESLLLDLEGDGTRWSTRRLKQLDLPASLLPPIHPCGTRIGALRDEAAELLGLRPGTPVALGGADTQCGLLGAGALQPADVATIAGTTAPVQGVLERPQVDERGRLWTARHVLPERWVLESNAGPVGEVLDWLAGLLFPDRAHAAAALAAEAADVEPGAAGVISSLGAEVMNARELAMPMGGLSLSHMPSSYDGIGRRQLARAVLEGMAFGIRANTEQILEVAGASLSSMRLSGGMSRSGVWAQMLSDVLGAPVEVSAAAEASALGAAICAGVGAGVFTNLAEGSRALVELRQTYEPHAAHVATYRELFEGWQRVREARVEADAVAAGMAFQAMLRTPTATQSSVTSRPRPRILVTADMDEPALQALRALGDVEHQSYREVMRLLTGPALVEALQGYTVFITEVDVVDAAALAKLPDLRVIAACRGDAVNIDLAACNALGIPVLHTPGRNADAVADLALAYMLALARKLIEANAFLREPGGEAGDLGRMGRAYKQLRGRELWRKKIGLIGLGAVGRGVARRARAFGAQILVYDPYLSEEQIWQADAEPVSLETLLRESDFVSLHAAVTDESRGLIGREELARMKPGACLINTARAALIDQEALLEALRDGRLAGAGLDVFEVEPPGADDPLLALPNVIATPHIGGNTEDVASHQGQIVAEDLARLLAGQRPRHLLNPETYEDFCWERERRVLSDEELARIAAGPGPAVTDLQKDKTPKKTKARSRRDVEPKKEDAMEAKTAGARGAEAASIREKMERLIGTFVEHVRSDRAMREFAAGRDVALHFTLTDLDLEFYFGFEGGEVIGALGAPEGGAGVSLKMPAEVLDGMLTGRINAMESAMSGKLSFSGDTAKAMTIQHIQADMNRLYSAAREEVGDLGDLAGLESAVPGAAPPPQVSVTENDSRHELVAIVNELYASQLITATGGNVSVRVPGTQDEIWITPSRLFKGDLRPEILVRINLDAEPLDKDARSPSSESKMHTAIYRARPEVKAVIHAHAPHATILVNADLPFLPISTEAAFFTKIGRIPFVMPGTPALGKAIVQAMGQGWACLMQNHGIVVAGRSLRSAADMAEIIDRSAEVIVGCYAVGKEPPKLPDETVEMLSKMADLIA